MRLLTVLLGLLVTVTLTACTSLNEMTLRDISSPEPVAMSVTTAVNPHSGLKKFGTKPVYLGTKNNDILYLLRGWRKSESNAFKSAQIYVTFPLLDNWVFFDAAHSEGKALDVTVLSRNVRSCSQDGCNISESIAIHLTQGQLRQYAKTGFLGEISGRNGAVVLRMPATFFQGYLMRLDAV